MRSQVPGFLLALLLSAGARGADPLPPAEPPAVTPQEQFFYFCVHEYLKAHGVPRFDGSAAYGVEHSNASGAVLARLQAAAKRSALALPAPNYRDEEHGAPAVLLHCQRQSQGPAIAALAVETGEED